MKEKNKPDIVYQRDYDGQHWSVERVEMNVYRVILTPNEEIGPLSIQVLWTKDAAIKWIEEHHREFAPEVRTDDAADEGTSNG